MMHTGTLTGDLIVQFGAVFIINQLLPEHDNNNSAEDNLHKLLFITVADVTSWKLSTVIQQSDQHLKTFMEQ